MIELYSMVHRKCLVSRDDTRQFWSRPDQKHDNFSLLDEKLLILYLKCVLKTYVKIECVCETLIYTQRSRITKLSGCSETIHQPEKISLYFWTMRNRHLWKWLNILIFLHMIFVFSKMCLMFIVTALGIWEKVIESRVWGRGLRIKTSGISSSS